MNLLDPLQFQSQLSLYCLNQIQEILLQIFDNRSDCSLDQNIKETNRVVDLLPEWYVKYQGQWYAVNDLLGRLPETEAN